MKIYVDTEEKKRFFSALDKIPINEEVEEIKEGNREIILRKKYIIFDDKKVDFDEFVSYFETIENRLCLAKYCLDKIKKDCEIIISDESDIKKLREKMEKETEVEPDFLYTSEYFIFAIKSCLDVMSHIINMIFNLGINKKNTSIHVVYKELENEQDVFAKSLLKAWNDWIDLFNEIRNKMAHHIILVPNSQLIDAIEEGKIVYNKYALRFSINYNSISKPLPTFFEETIDNLNCLLDEFYKKLNTLNIS